MSFSSARSLRFPVYIVILLALGECGLCQSIESIDQCPTEGWQVLPAGLMYKSYLAGEKEPRMNAVWLRDQSGKLNWETQLGGRVGLLRLGSSDAILPQGTQLDLEGGAQARVLPEVESDLEAADFRAGILMTRRQGPWSAKYGYYHLSSHAGDEFLLKNPTFQRVNYVRDAVLCGISREIIFRGTPSIRVYGELAYAINHQFGEPWEIQAGVEYSPIVFNGLRGTPVIAVNSHAREDRDWGATSVNLVAGWQWYGERTGHRFRLGGQYYEGAAIQWEFINQRERLLGLGMWFDY